MSRFVNNGLFSKQGVGRSSRGSGSRLLLETWRKLSDGYEHCCWVVHGEVTFAVLDSEIFAVSRCCLSFAIQHLGPPTEIYEVVVVVVPTGRWTVRGPQRLKIVQIGVCVDPDPWDDVFALLGP